MSPFHGHSRTVRQAKIVGGFFAEPNEFPHQINLRYNDQLSCGASIINTMFLLTAAHCVKYRLASHFSAVAGDHNQDEDDETEQIRNISQIFLHEEYNWDTDDNDIALLALTQPFVFNTFVNSISFPKVPTEFFGMGIVTGWGKVAEGSISSNILMKVKLPLVPRNECRERYRRARLTITENMICAGEVGKDACNGDSGSGLMCRDLVTGNATLCGIVSHGVGCGRESFPGVYTDVSRYSSWIEEKIKQYTLRGKCKGDRFYCYEDKKCISRTSVCNRKKDCKDGSDEKNCQSYERTTQNHFRCNNGLSIKSAWLCDNFNDCGDEGSDEFKCLKAPCSSTQFSCKSDHRCIDKAWECDNIIDCEDASDEIECNNLIHNTTSEVKPLKNDTEGCEKDSFLCRGKLSKGICIPMRWRCDHEKDCRGGEDEADCNSTTTTTTTTPPKPLCSENEFKCDTGGYCIPLRFKCDGDNDCPSGEDERRCSSHVIGTLLNSTIITSIAKPRSCSNREYQCKTGECLSKDFKCDFDRDCPLGDDEANCTLKPQCTSRQWKCRNGDCIYHRFRCDKEIDCVDASDEIGCNKDVNNTKNQCSDSEFPCKNGDCLPMSLVCDTDKDCEQGEDEEGCLEPEEDLFLFF